LPGALRIWQEAPLKSREQLASDRLHQPPSAPKKEKAGHAQGGKSQSDPRPDEFREFDDVAQTNNPNQRKLNALTPGHRAGHIIQELTFCATKIYNSEMTF